MSKTPTLLPKGTRIRFLKRLDSAATEDHPACVYAEKGQLGTVTGHGTIEGHWVKVDGWPHAFGAELGVEFEAATTEPNDANA